MLCNSSFANASLINLGKISDSHIGYEILLNYPDNLNGIKAYIANVNEGGLGLLIGYSYSNARYGVQIKLRYDSIGYRFFNNGTWSQWKILT